MHFKAGQGKYDKWKWCEVLKVHADGRRTCMADPPAWERKGERN